MAKTQFLWIEKKQRKFGSDKAFRLPLRIGRVTLMNGPLINIDCPFKNIVLLGLINNICTLICALEFLIKI